MRLLTHTFYTILLLFSSLLANAKELTSFDSSLIKTDLGYNEWSIVSQSVINIRREPDFRAEMITQALLGTPIKVLATYKNWSRIETPEGYSGWTSAPVKRQDSISLHAYNKLARVIVTQNNAFVYSKPSKSSEIVSEVVMGNILKLNTGKKTKDYYPISFPDGRTGYIAAHSVLKWEEWKKSITLTGKSIEKVSKRFLGVPYLWGGASPRGLDCSGLTKTAYLMHGIILPRDARQQYLCGLAIDSSDHFNKLQKGDLLFFGIRSTADSTKHNIIHTGIYLQDQQFINAGSGYVRIGSLRATDKNYDQVNYSRYVGAKRFLKQPPNGFWSIFTHPWYQ